jgi:UDP-N-acetylmuramate--alanine ligase
MYHFIGIGGIGMSALARLLVKAGKKVRGSDVKKNGVTKALKKEGIIVKIGHKADNIKKRSLVVYNSEVGADNVEMMRAKELNLTTMHRFDVLFDLMKEKKALLVAGTHGKTTTTALLVETLLATDVSFMLGGILNSCKTNARLGEGEYFVSETDESDGSFLRAKGFGAIVTNIDYDHMNFWQDRGKQDEAFKEFCTHVEDKGKLFWCYDDDNLRRLNIEGISYGLSEGATLRAINVKQLGFFIIFDIVFEQVVYKDIKVRLVGDHNVLNSLAVFGLCLKLGIKEEIIRAAFINFLSVERRLFLKKEEHKILFFDDYGHHPTEIKKTLRGLREAIGERRLLVLFQPHRYTRTKDFFDEFPLVFDDADMLFCTDLYAASERPINGIDGRVLFENIKKRKKDAIFIDKDTIKSIVSYLRPHDVFLTIGAGDVTKMGDEIIDSFVKKKKKKLKVGVIFGGKSSEHEVSLVSAHNVYDSFNRDIYDVEAFYIDKEGKWAIDNSFDMKESREDILPKAVFKKLLECDVCLPIMHGPNGEDGSIQGFFSSIGIPYGGCDYMSCGICMHKGWLKHLVKSSNIKTAAFCDLNIMDWKRKRDLSFITVNFPLYVKPCRLGSSIGIKRAANEKELIEAIDYAFLHDNDIIIEEEVKGRQIEFAVLGHDYVDVAIGGEILTYGGFYSYEKKYGPDPMKTQVPAELSEEKMKEGQELAKRIYKLACCSGFARVDLFLSEDMTFYLNEINPIPGFTGISLYPKMWEASGVRCGELLDKIIISSLYKHKKSLR